MLQERIKETVLHIEKWAYSELHWKGVGKGLFGVTNVPDQRQILPAACQQEQKQRPEPVATADNDAD